MAHLTTFRPGTACGALAVAAAAMSFGAASTAHAAVITLFDESAAASFNNGNSASALDTTTASVGTNSWKITGGDTVSGSRNYFTAEFTMQDNMAPVYAFDPANGAQLTFDYKTTATDFRVHFILVALTNPGGNTTTTVYPSSPNIIFDLVGGDDTWRTMTFTPTLIDPAAQALVQTDTYDYRFRFQGWPNTSSATQVAGDTINIDNVQISYNPIPEPASLGLLALGGLALLRRR